MSDRRRMGRRAVAALTATAVVILLGTTVVLPHRPAESVRLVGYGSSIVGTQRAPGASSSAPGVRAIKSFTISGTMQGLYPGANLPLVLIVANPQSVTIKVTAISTTVSGSSSCPGRNVAVSPYTGRLKVRRRSVSRVTVQVTMARSALDACQGNTFVFHYIGTANE